MLQMMILLVCEIDTNKLVSKGGVSEWYPLFFEKKPAGEILLEISFTDKQLPKESSKNENQAEKDEKAHPHMGNPNTENKKKKTKKQKEHDKERSRSNSSASSDSD